jgi:hypothetical protein
MNTIVGKGYVNIRDEKVANAAITPGMLVERMSTDKVKAHATAGGPVNALFAIENENEGEDIDDDYAATDIVKLWRPVPGEQVYAIVDDTTQDDIVIGDFLESAGDGRLRKITTNTSAGLNEFSNSIVGVALEAVDQAGAGGRILIEIV